MGGRGGGGGGGGKGGVGWRREGEEEKVNKLAVCPEDMSHLQTMHEGLVEFETLHLSPDSFCMN